MTYATQYNHVALDSINTSNVGNVGIIEGCFNVLFHLDKKNLIFKENIAG